MAQKIRQDDIDPSVNIYPLFGSATAPSAPAIGSGILYGIGTGNVRPGFMNNQGNLERLASVLGSNTVIQSGSTTSSAGGGVTVTFPTAFAAGSTPLVFVQIQGGGGSNYAAVDTAPTNTGFNLAAWTLGGALATRTVGWFAIGTP